MGCIYLFLASFWCHLHSTQNLWFFQWHKCFLKDLTSSFCVTLSGSLHNHNKLTACPSCTGLLKTFVPSQCCHHNIWRTYVFVSYFTSSRCVKTFCSQLEELLCCWLFVLGLFVGVLVFFGRWKTLKHLIMSILG